MFSPTSDIGGLRLDWADLVIHVGDWVAADVLAFEHGQDLLTHG